MRRPKFIISALPYLPGKSREKKEKKTCVCVKGGEPIQRGGVHATLPQNYDNSRRNQRTVERERENEKTTPQWSKK